MLRAQPVVGSDRARRLGLLGGGVGEQAERAPDVQHAVDVALHVLLDRQPAAARFGQDRRHAVLRRGAVQHARPLATRQDVRHPAHAAVGLDHLDRPGVDLRVTGLVVAQERLEPFDHVAGVQVHRAVDLHHHVVEQVMREALAPGASGVAGEGAVQVLIVLGIDVDRTLEEAGPIQQGDDDDGARDVLGIEGLAEAQRGQGAGVLGGVDAGRQQKGQSGLAADDGEVRPLVFAEQFVVKREIAGCGGCPARGAGSVRARAA